MTAGQLQDSSRSKILVGEEVVEGKLCYIYSDRTHCPKSINGDVVNPKWGTTKAGKPRKRLGQACNTCREKKIRCDPQVPKCAQCQKFQRDCRFEQRSVCFPRTSFEILIDHSARGSQRSSRGSPPSDLPPSMYRRGSVQHDRNSSDTSTERTGAPRGARSSISVEHLLSPTSTHSPGTRDSPPIKKRKYSTSPNMGMSDVPTTPQKPHEADTFSLDADPFQVDANLSQAYLAAYFKHFNAQLYCIFPQQRFMEWASDGRRKPNHDKLIVYSMMALGTVFSPGRCAEHQEILMDIVEQTLRSGSCLPTLQVVQARLLMTMLRFSRGELLAARDSCALLMKMAMDLGLNNEPTVVEPLCFGLDDQSNRECRRRTFWTAYMVDSSLHYCVDPNARVASIDSELRLPCEDEQYERGLIGCMPLARLHGSYHDVPLSQQSSTMAKVIGITAILRETVSYLQCLRGVHPEHVRNTQMHFQETTVRQLEQWRQQVTGQAVQQGQPTVEGERQRQRRELEPSPLLLLVHFAKMLVFRHVRHNVLSRDQVEANVRGARHEAYELLKLLHRLGERASHSDSALITVCPITGFATFIAVDIITAAGSMSSAMENTADDHNTTHPEHMEASFMDLLQAGLVTLEGLGQYWETARKQAKQVKSRFHSFMSARFGLGHHKEAYYVQQPLYSPFGGELDGIYGLPKADLFNVLGMDESNAGEIPEGTQSP